ncbi:hypothetical protein H0H81_002273 [Sphagnurus paluster]|uniref:Uncharacterized protein n=1 Tax=Sphagnurus paluster TaxID=117069 RepID=A0A9P7FZC1_9AGAR|nr:hypothetical protein H0H81_002273 [Sphagnurus paluster]
MVSFNALLIAASVLIASAGATKIHANSGCILVNDRSLCEKKGPKTLDISGGRATIYARFDSGNRLPTQTPGCRLDAVWPPSFNDVYFGQDNCLYDAGGQNINGQCCAPGTGGGNQVTNPYYG